MKWQSTRHAYCVCFVAALGVAFSLASPRMKSSPGRPSADVEGKYGKLPLYFIENKGQVDERAAYYLQGGETSAYFMPGGVMFALEHPRTHADDDPLFVSASNSDPVMLEGWALKLEFVGANSNTPPVGVDRSEAVVSYFKGTKADWKAGVPIYTGVLYKDLWPGIDLLYTGTSGKLKYTFTLAPGSDPDRIRLAYHGASDVTVNDRGRLEVQTPVGGFEEDRPYVYQEIDGQRVEVESAFDADGRGFGFHLGEYDRTRTLFLDPAILVYSGYIGGAALDIGQKIAVDSAGNAYVVGETLSGNLPVTQGALKKRPGRRDVFLVKLNAAGNALIYAVYLGGTNHDYTNGLALDSGGNAYISGGTQSLDFPRTVGPACRGSNDPNRADLLDGFVAKINASGKALSYTRCIGGAAWDRAQGIAVNSLGNAYVVGATGSVDFPVTANWSRTGPNGRTDLFLAKLSIAGEKLEYARYFGGSGDETAQGGVAIDSLGSAYVSGRTNSLNFPVTTGWPYPGYRGGIADAFVSKVDTTGALVYSGYLGSSGEDESRSIAVGRYGDAYVTGLTTAAGFPVTPQWHYPTYHGGVRDAFVTKVNWQGTGLVYSGYLGGTNSDFGYNIAVDNQENAYIVGATASIDFPVVSWPITTNTGLFDAFVLKLRNDGSQLIYSGYLGGSGQEWGNGIALDSLGNAYVTGETQSSNFPVHGMGPAFADKPGTDAFVAKIKPR